MKRALISLMFVLLIVVGSCGGDDSSSKGGVGESCTKTADCKDGLKCIDLVCVSDSGNTGNTGDTGDTGNTGDIGNSGKEEYSWNDFCEILCEVEIECFSEDWEGYDVDGCIPVCLAEMASEVDEGDILDTNECREAFYKVYSCLAVYSCDVLAEDEECEEDCLCDSGWAKVESVCFSPDDDDDDSCADGEKKCSGTTFMWCTGGIWATRDCKDSGKICNETKGCITEDGDTVNIGNTGSNCPNEQRTCL
jgi:hypothetical protein